MMGKLIILTGASGSGKVTVAKSLSAARRDIQCFFFDTIGVPPVEKMIAEFGSGEEWQRAMTIEWLARLKEAQHAG